MSGMKFANPACLTPFDIVVETELNAFWRTVDVGMQTLPIC